MELEEKFNLPTRILDARTYRDSLRTGYSPLTEPGILIMSYHYANRIGNELKAVAWDLVVIDEAHKLRNSYRPSNKIGRGIRWATEGCKKLLLTATPLQNSLLEVYGLSTLIDEYLFGDVNAFRAQYASGSSTISDLRERLTGFCKRTLRNQVTEYVRYTERRAVTRPFTPSDEEHALYEAISAFVNQPDSYALPSRQRHLTALILRKLLASSSPAIAATLDTLRMRLEALRDNRLEDDDSVAQRLIDSEEIEDDLLDEILPDDDEAASEPGPAQLDRKKLIAEIDELRRLADWARSIGVDAKTTALVQALEIGFGELAKIGASRKALIFTESRRTQDYLKTYLESNGYAGQVVVFNGSNSGPESAAIYEKWVSDNQDSGRVTGSRAVDIRTALIEHFRDEATIMLATEAAAEGVNLQFCSQVINYDLPWNPQRIEQRIGRCHRYGQKHDVVVVNFLNSRNDVDRRVLELLGEKFSLFNGVFGASDEVLGSIESGVDFEKRILSIYQECRNPEEIDAAFKALQSEMDESIRTRLDDTRRKLFEHFDEDVHERLRMKLVDARAQLDRVGRRFWSLTRYVLADRAHFNNELLTFDLHDPPHEAISPGRYHLISKSQPESGDEEHSKHRDDEPSRFLYRLSHPLGELVVDRGKVLDTRQAAKIVFDVTNHPTRLHVVEALRGKQGYLTLVRLVIDSLEREEYLLFSGFDELGTALDSETIEKLFACSARLGGCADISDKILARLSAEGERHAKGALSRSLEQNSAHFNVAREKLEKWADDMVHSAEKALKDTKEQIKVLRREARQATTLEEQRAVQEKTRRLERRQRRQRQEIFNVEDEIMDKRDSLIDSLERRLAQKTDTETLFTVAWAVQ
jgi:superfamily II DNA/RNA helicase